MIKDRKQTTIEVVRECVEEVGGFEETCGNWPPPADDQSLFYDARKESHAAAEARGSVGLDSLDQVELLMLLEDEFGSVTFGEAEPSECGNTIEAIAAWVDRKLAAA